MIIVVAVMSAVLAASAQVISHAQQRDRETQLLWAGDQIRRALLDYSKLGVGIEAFPTELGQLLEDKRQAVKRNHLRRLYFDPMTASTDWGLILNPQQRIIGVYSKSTKAPIRTDNFLPAYANFRNAASYAEWKFAVGEAPGLPGEAKSKVEPAKAVPVGGESVPPKAGDSSVKGAGVAVGVGAKPAAGVSAAEAVPSSQASPPDEIGATPDALPQDGSTVEDAAPAEDLPAPSE